VYIPSSSLLKQRQSSCLSCNWRYSGSLIQKSPPPETSSPLRKAHRRLFSTSRHSSWRPTDVTNGADPSSSRNNALFPSFRILYAPPPPPLRGHYPKPCYFFLFFPFFISLLLLFSEIRNSPFSFAREKFLFCNRLFPPFRICRDQFPKVEGIDPSRRMLCLPFPLLGGNDSFLHPHVLRRRVFFLL